MPAYATSFEAAPLDRTARPATKALWVAAAGLVVAGLGVAVLGSAWSGLALVVVGACLVMMLAGDAPVALSPREPDRFVAEVGRGA